jgi:DNA-directed RNA polymerase
VRWAQEHKQLIIDSVQDPLDGERFWSHADEPWLFLALAMDFAEGISRVPVRLDATASGLQHLSALALDERVGAVVNLVPGRERGDIYSIVAQAAAEATSELALRGDPMALRWAGKVDRSTVKQAVMATPYGITTSGIRQGLLEHAVKVAPEKLHEAAKFMAFRITEAVTGKLGQPALVMQYLRDAARIIAEPGNSVTWTTPSGCVVTQGYAKPALVRTNTLLGKLTFIEPGKPAERPNVAKAINSAPANYVHSLDAALLMRIVNQWDQPLTVVHDAIGTHAGAVGRLAQLARDSFADQYRLDWLERFHEEQARRHPQLAKDLPARPPRGALDVEACRDAVFMFS